MTLDQAKQELATIEPQAAKMWANIEHLKSKHAVLVEQWQPLYSRCRELEIYIKMQQEQPKP